jgi:PST family polysaccharide transporter
MLFAGQVIVQFFSLLVGILVARNMGQSIFGQYSLALVFVGMFSVFFTLGTDPLIIRQIAQFPDQKQEIVSSAYWIRLAGFPITLAAAMLAGYLFRYSSTQRFFIVLAAGIVGVSAMGDLPRMVFQGLQKMELDTLTRVIEKTAALLLVWIALMFSPNLGLVMGGLIIGAIIGTLASWVILKLRINYRLDFIPRGSLSLLKQSAPLTVSMFLVGLYMRLPQVILSFYRPVDEVGLFTAAYSTMLPFTYLSLAFTGAFLPVLSGMMGSSPQLVNKHHESLITYSLMLGLPSAACLALFSRDFLRILYGNSYLAASPALVILSLNVLFFFLLMHLNNIVIAGGRQKKLVIVTFINLISAFVFTLLLTPQYGMIGTSISIILTEAVSLVVMLYFTSHIVKHRMNRKAISAILATVFMLVGSMVASPLSFWLRAPLSLFVYGLGLWITGGVTVDDFRLILTTINPSSQMDKMT